MLVLVFFEVTLPEFLCAQLRFRSHQSLHQLRGTHLQGENGYGDIVVHRHVARHGQDESRLSHTWTRGQHHHVRALPSPSQLVQSIETCGHTAHAVLVEAGLVDALNDLSDDRPHLLVTLTNVALGHLEKLLLRAVQQIKHICGVFKRGFDGLARNPNQLPLNEFLGHNARVCLHIGTARDAVGKPGDISGPATKSEHAFFAQLLRDREQVDGFRTPEQLLDRLVDLTVRILVKSLRLEDINHGIDRGGFEHTCAQHGFLQLNGLRRLLADSGHTGGNNRSLDGRFALVAEGFVIGHEKKELKDQNRPHKGVRPHPLSTAIQHPYSQSTFPPCLI